MLTLHPSPSPRLPDPARIGYTWYNRVTSGLNVSESLDIVIMSGPYDGESHRMNAPRDPVRGYVLGRRPECDLAFAYDDWVSGQHARLYQNGASWFVEDLNSTNRTHIGRRRRDGTFVGRELVVGPMPIADGQLIQLGRLWIRVRFVQ